MGRLFTYEAIEAGRIPDSATFEMARELYEQAVQEGCKKGLIDGSFIYGSVAVGLSTVRSDMDTFIALSDSARPGYEFVRDMITEISKEIDHKMPLSPILRTRRSLAFGRHEMDRFLGQHLASEFRLVQGNDPAGYINFQPHSAYDIMASYLFQKKRRLANAYVSSPLELRDGSGLQRMLELPAAVGRKALQACADVNVHNGVVEKSADKRMVLGKSQKLFEQLGVEGPYNTLLEANAAYDELLDEAIKGRVSQPEYEYAIRDFHAELPEAIGWLESVELALLPKLAR